MCKNVFRTCTYGESGGANCPHIGGQNDIIFGIEAHAYTKATHTFSVDTVLPRGVGVVHFVYYVIYMRNP
jgi:hypothetical protein